MDATRSLDEIAVFVHVVQAGSFTAAARQRNVPKSTLSRAVTRLEETMHARLLQRSSRRIALTEAGRAFAFVHAALHAGAGIGSMPSFLATRSLAEGRLVRVLPGWSRASATVFFVYPAARHVPRKVIAFRDFVLESFGRPVPRGR
jgi:DNA-binding transcriptional LysR family regulator